MSTTWERTQWNSLALGCQGPSQFGLDHDQNLGKNATEQLSSWMSISRHSSAWIMSTTWERTQRSNLVLGCQGPSRFGLVNVTTTTHHHHHHHNNNNNNNKVSSSVQHGERYDNVSLSGEPRKYCNNNNNNNNNTTHVPPFTSGHLKAIANHNIFICCCCGCFFVCLVWWVDFVCLLACLLACLLICFCFFSFQQFKFKARVIKLNTPTKQLHQSSGRGTVTK